MNSITINIYKYCFFFAVLTSVSCSRLPPSDTHTVVGQSPERLKGWRLEESFVGQWLEVPTEGKVTVLDFWSSTCKPCIESMPHLESIWQRIDRDAVIVIGINIDDNDTLARKTAAEKFPSPVTFPLVFDGKSKKIQGIYRVAGKVPSTFVLDKQGNVRFFFDGSPGDMNKLEQAVAALMDE